MASSIQHQQITQPRIFAHRGSTLLAPENTCAAFDVALAHDADVLETDVRLSLDGHVIVTHDDTVNRTTNGSGTVKSLPLHEIKQLDAGYRTRTIHGVSHAGQGVQMITLDELLDQYRNIAINIDIKDNDIEAAVQVARAIDRHDRQYDATVGSFHSRLLLRFRSIAPHIRTAAVRGEIAKLYFNRILPGQRTEPREYQSVQIPMSYRLIPLGTRRFIEKVQNYGADVCFWTVNEPVKMRQLLTLGANGVITDRPDLAQQVFQEMGFKPGG